MFLFCIFMCVFVCLVRVLVLCILCFLMRFFHMLLRVGSFLFHTAFLCVCVSDFLFFFSGTFLLRGLFFFSVFCFFEFFVAFFFFFFLIFFFFADPLFCFFVASASGRSRFVVSVVDHTSS